MYLKDYFSNIKKKYSKYSFLDITFDSSKVKKNYIFFAVKGNKINGERFIQNVVKKGVAVIVCSKKEKIHNNPVYFDLCNVDLYELFKPLSYTSYIFQLFFAD